MIRITDTITLAESEIEFRFIRSPGPGGQHVNKAATGVELRFDIKRSNSVTDNVKLRLLQLAKNRISTSGILVIKANRFRSQDLNRKDALARLSELIEKATKKRKPRRRTKPSISSIKKQKEAKQRHSKLKRTRRKVVCKAE